jgi:hypothetical protein
VKRVLAALAVVVVVAAVVTGLLIWRLAQDPPPEHPEISAYSHGQLVRVGPYRYCEVLNPTDCETPKTDGELTVDRATRCSCRCPPR